MHLERMNRALDTLDYRGQLVHQQGGELRSLSIAHRGGESGGRERLRSLDGPALELVRSGERVRCYREGGRASASALVNPLRETLPAWSERLAQHYRLSSLGSARVADRRVDGIAVNPRDRLRYGYQLWMDPESGLPLWTQVLDESGRVVEEVRFIDLELGVALAEPELSLDPAHAEQAFELPAPPTDVAALDPAVSGWWVEQLPPGFELSGRSLEPTAQGTREQLVFSDGLATVSVFVEPYATVAEPLVGSAQVGKLRAYGTRVGEFQLTLLGEVPTRTLEQIGDSLRQRD